MPEAKAYILWGKCHHPDTQVSFTFFLCTMLAIQYKIATDNRRQVMMEDREGEREKTDNRNRSSSDSNDGIIKQAIKSMINMWKNLKDRMEIFAIQFGIVKKKAI